MFLIDVCVVCIVSFAEDIKIVSAGPRCSIGYSINANFSINSNKVSATSKSSGTLTNTFIKFLCFNC